VEQAQERYLKTVPVEFDLSVTGLGISLPLGTTVCLATSALFDLDFLESYFSVRNANLQKKNVREIMEVSKDLCDLLVIDVQNILFAKKLTAVLNDLVEAGFDRDIIIVHSAKYSIYMQEYTNLKHHFIARPVYAKKLDALLDLIFYEKK